MLGSPICDGRGTWESSTSGLRPLRRLNHCMTLRALMVDVPVVVEVVVIVVMGVMAREALKGVSPVSVFPFRFLIVRLNGSSMTVSVLRLFSFFLATSLGVGLSNESSTGTSPVLYQEQPRP